MLKANILKNIKILDLSDEKGSLCMQLLSDMGAEITRIVKPGNAESRTANSSIRHCIALDIEAAQDRDSLRHMAHTSDIIVECFPPGYLDSRGLGYTELSRVNPGIIVASITPYGQSGPRRNYRSSELVASAMGGQAYVCGEPGKPPLKPSGPQAYYTACLFAVNGILLALWQKHNSKQGQHIDISIHECVAGTLDHVLVRYFYEEEIAQRQGSLYWNNAFRIFSCRDGYVLLSLSLHWETLIEWMDSEGMAEDLKGSKWLDEAERQKNLDHIIQVLEKWTRRHTAGELVEQGQLMGFPWAKIASIPEIVDNPQLNERGFIPQVKAQYSRPQSECE